jgi:hypothetical protein
MKGKQKKSTSSTSKSNIINIRAQIVSSFLYHRRLIDMCELETKRQQSIFKRYPISLLNVDSIIDYV